MNKYVDHSNSDLRLVILANLNLFIILLIPALSWQLTMTCEVNSAWKNNPSSEALEALLGQQRLCFSQLRLNCFLSSFINLEQRLAEKKLAQAAQRLERDL